MLHDTMILERSSLDNYDLTQADVAVLAEKSERTIRRWVDVGLRGRGRLPALHTVHGLRFRPSEVEDFLRPRPVLSREDTDAARMDAAVARVLATLPPLTAEQRVRIGRIIGGA